MYVNISASLQETWDFQILSGLLRPREQGIEGPATFRVHVESVQEETGQSQDGSSEAHKGKAGPGREAAWQGEYTLHTGEKANKEIHWN